MISKNPKKFKREYLQFGEDYFDHEKTINGALYTFMILFNQTEDKLIKRLSNIKRANNDLQNFIDLMKDGDDYFGYRD